MPLPGLLRAFAPKAPARVDGPAALASHDHDHAHDHAPAPMAPLDPAALPTGAAAGPRVPPSVGLRALTPHEQKVEAAAAQVTKQSLLQTLTVLCKDPIYGPREASTGEYILAAKWVASQLEAMGVEPLGDLEGTKRTFLQWFEWRESFTPKDSKSANVVGLIKGTGPEPRKAVVLSAHLDNLSKAEKDYYTRKDGRDLATYEGANDNTASVAILMDTVKAIKATGPYEHDVIVLVSSAEEDYLMGAAAFVADPPVPLQRMIANVNLEMPGEGAIDEVYVYGGKRDADQRKNPLWERAIRVTARHEHPLQDGLIIDAGEGWHDRQDGGVFHNVGIPNILLQGGGAHGHYHTNADTVESLNMDKVEVLGRHTARIMADLLDDVDPAEKFGKGGRGSANPSGRYVETFASIDRRGGTRRSG